MIAAVAGAETSHRNGRFRPAALMERTRPRVDPDKSVVPSKMTRGEKWTPRVWITTSTTWSALRIVSGSSASPDT